MSEPSATVTVEHHPDEQRFVARAPEGEGELTYAFPAPGVVDLQHTGVAEALRGHGAADALVRAAVAYARAAHLRVVPTCRFARKWFARHPAEQDLLAG